VARGIFENIFEFLGSDWNFSGLQLDFRLVQGFFAKWRGISVGDLFFNRKYRGGPGPQRLDRAARLRSTVD
jgi:hypothetical protein